MLLDREGTPVHDLDDRIIAASAADLEAIPQLIAVAGSVCKSTAILAALRSGMVTTLVTDDSVARVLLGT